jgi:cardiolipin synthase
VHEVGGHKLTLLRSGTEYFPQLFAAIHAARHTIYLETYIFAADQTGRLLKAALESAAARDVSVHVLLDGFGSAELPPAWLGEMRMLGVKVLWFRPELARWSLRRHRLRRLHRKLVVIDGRIAFVGGINILDESQEARLDYAVQVQGEVVAQITHAVRSLWRLVSWTHLRKSGLPRERMVPSAQQHDVAFLIRDNLRHRRDIEHAYLRAIKHARSEIVIANAYFLPGRRFRRFLLAAARRGVRVVLLLQGKMEYRLQHYATLALYEDLLLAGMEIYEYTPSFLHAKVAVIDGEWATVGSSNIDPFSLLMAREANIIVKDNGFAAGLRGDLLEAITHGGKRVMSSDLQHRALWGRIVLRISYAVVRFLTGISGYAHRRDDF